MGTHIEPSYSPDLIPLFGSNSAEQFKCTITQKLLQKLLPIKKKYENNKSMLEE